uniref:lecithin retinol acyltransferase family protein n=1 Tax=Clostridium sp. 12(A) TaxID=1163671 RepID=UPI0004667451|nr:lecithin retinol acyltransferase family protein [Clostridium sp. 12(A)]
MFIDDIFEAITDKIGDIKYAIEFTVDQAKFEQEQRRDKHRKMLNDARSMTEFLSEDTIFEPIVKSVNLLCDKAENINETIGNASHLYSGTKIIDSSKLTEGDHLFINKGLYSHHGLYLGGDEVMHFSKNDFDIMIHRTSLENFKNGYVLYRLSSSDSPIIYEICEVVTRAYLKEGLSGYDLFSNNCENFVRWCRNGSNI